MVIYLWAFLIGLTTGLRALGSARDRELGCAPWLAASGEYLVSVSRRDSHVVDSQPARAW